MIIPASTPWKLLRFQNGAKRTTGPKESSETRPGERYDTEYRTFRIPRQSDAHDGDDDDGRPGSQHGFFRIEFHTECVSQKIVGYSGSGSQELGIRRGHGRCQDTG